MTSLTNAVNTFGERLFQALPQAPDGAAGVFLSPVCIAQALAMLLNGVEPGGESYTQLQQAVFGASPGNELGLDSLNSQLHELSASLVKGSDGANLTVADANSAWVAQRYSLQPGYSQALSKYFSAQVQPITTAQVVNDWVSTATRGKITRIVDDDALRQATCVLINALYFKGLWEMPFKNPNTGPVPFHSLQGRTSDAAMMYQQFKPRDSIKVARFQASLAGAGPGAGAFADVAGTGAPGSGAAGVPCIALQLPYKGGDFAAVLAMPEGNLSSTSEGAPLHMGSGLPYAAALAGCRASLLAGLAQGAGVAAAGAGPPLTWQAPGMQVKLWLPRFEVEFGASLSSALRLLGVTKPFQGGDITRVAASQDGTPVGDLQVSDVIHKVYVKVDEAGTEAAAVTAVMMLKSAMVREPPTLTLKFDRPFTFAVVHLGSGAALFVGEVQQPEVWGQGGDA